MRAIVGVFVSMEAAARAVAALERQHYPRSTIRIVAHSDDALGPAPGSADELRAGARAGAGTGGIAGIATGGALGLLAVLGVLAPAGCDPLIAVGPLFAIFTLAGIGAASGMLVGSLVGMATNRRAPDVDQRGGTLVIVRTDDSDLDTIADLLARHGASHIDQRDDLHEPPVASRTVDRPVAHSDQAAFHDEEFELGEFREAAEEVVVRREVRQPDAATRVRARSATGPMRSRTKILKEPFYGPIVPVAAHPRVITK